MLLGNPHIESSGAESDPQTGSILSHPALPP
jgi:hypothetical protein